MEIKIRHDYAASAETVWPVLTAAICRHPDLRDKKIQWSDRRGEGEYAGCRIRLDLIEDGAGSCRVEAVISGPALVLSFLEDRIRSSTDTFLRTLEPETS